MDLQIKSSCKCTKTCLPAGMLVFRNGSFLKLTESMSATKTGHLRLVILFALLQTNGFSFSQTPPYSVGLTRLHLTTKQIVSMLGVSTDSIHKTRQRLRERFQISDSATLKELILGV
jgi:hypothetical protein